MLNSHALSRANAQTFRLVWAAAFLSVFTFTSTASELECRGKDISGVTSCWSKSSSAALRSFPINLVDLPNAVIGGITHRLRNNSVSHYRVTLDPGGLSDSWLSLQVAGTAFGPGNTRYVEDLEAQKRLMGRFAGRSAFPNLIRIRDHSRTGWLGVYKSGTANRWCYAVLLAFEPSPLAAEYADELYEMVFRMKDCTGRRTRVQLEDWLHSVRAVPDGYNGK